ncbi:hypothetical protein V8F06_004571 [Rhypophila decipiens]
MAASSRMVGRRAQDIFSQDIAPTVTRFNTRQQTGRQFSATATALAMNRRQQRESNRALSPRVASQRQNEQMGGFSASKIPMFLPGTFILPLASKLPREPSVLYPFLKAYIKTRFTDTAATYLAKFASMKSFFSRPTYKLKNSSVVATAKGLHRSMSEALASGDKTTIRKVCADRMADTLIATIDARPAGKRYAWDLVKYTHKLRYPRIMSQKIAKIDQSRDSPMIRQVVVRICSRQRRVELDKNGEVVPGSEREVDLVENIAMSAVINPQTWKQDEWRIIGTAKDTTPDSWDAEVNLMKQVEALEVTKHKIL